MARTASIARALHDLGLAAWFGGSLMGAVGLEGGHERQGTAGAVGAPGANAAWARWKPVNRAAIAAHLVGGTVLTFANRRRVRHQKGVFALSATKAALTCAAVAATAYGEALARKVDEAGPALEDEPLPSTRGAALGSPERTAAERQRRAMRWLVPALTGGIAVTSALLGERQRPQRMLRDAVRSLPDHLPSLAALPAISDLGDQLRHLPDHLPKLPDMGRLTGALSDVHLPEVHLPDVRLPDVHVPDFKLPDVRLPDLPKPSRLPFRKH